MTALSTATGFTPRSIKYFQFVLANAIVAYPGAAMFWDPVNGVATIGSANPALIYLGRCAEDVSPITGNGTSIKVNVDLDIEVTLTYFTNGTSTDAVVLATDFLKPCYALDDNTVSRLPSGKPLVGIVWDVNPLKGVGVAKIGTVPPQLTLSAPVLPAFAANAIVLANVISDALYDVPATAGVSTITLPAAAPDGTIVYFRADGVKNANTVQYLDATGAVALTAALTAAKRHLATFTKLGTAWTGGAFVSP